MRLFLSLELASMALLSFAAASPLPGNPTSPGLVPSFQQGGDIVSLSTSFPSERMKRGCGPKACPRDIVPIVAPTKEKKRICGKACTKDFIPAPVEKRG